MMGVPLIIEEVPLIMAVHGGMTVTTVPVWIVTMIDLLPERVSPIQGELFPVQAEGVVGEAEADEDAGRKTRD